MVEFLVVGTVAGLIQIAAALPWIAVVDSLGFKAWFRRLGSTFLGLQVVGGTLVGLVAASVLFRVYVTDQDQLLFWGRVYGSLLQLQLTADWFVLIFMLLLALWPQGAAVALAAFREGIRQPMFWLLTLTAFALMF